MQNEALAELFKKLSTDKNLGNQFLSKKTDDEQYEFALSIVSGYTKEEFLQALKLIKQFENTEKTELSDENLDNVVGGSGFFLAMSFLTGFLGGGGNNAFKTAGNAFTKAEKEKKYRQFRAKLAAMGYKTDEEVAGWIIENQQKKQKDSQIQAILNEYKQTL